MLELIELLENIAGNAEVTSFISCVYGNTEKAEEMLNDYLFYLSGYRDYDQFVEAENEGR